MEGRGSIVKRSEIGCVYAATLIIDGREQDCFVKKRRYVRRYERLIQRLGGSGLRRAAGMADRFLEEGISTPVPWGFMTVSGVREPLEFFLTQGSRRAVSVYAYLLTRYPCLSRCEQDLFRRKLSLKLADLVSRMHQAGYENRDLKVSNLILRDAEGASRNEEELDLLMIDLEGVRNFGRIPWFRRERDLARLNLSLLRAGCFTAADRMRFFKSYQERLGIAESRRGWERIAKVTEQRQRATLERGKTIH